jgi:NAD(P)-dependent dehydrogenase (short-subunit alcohol dehydrogenase family)
MSNNKFIDFDQKYIVVTGATSGIGQAISLELSRQNARLILSGRNEKLLNDMKEELGGRDHSTLCIDLNITESIVPALKEATHELGRIYGLCHCAGIVETRPLASVKSDSFKAMYNINLIAGIEFARFLSRRDVVDEHGGSFLFISSVYGMVGMAGQLGYSASKGAILSAVRSMAIELARRKIRVNALSPGLVKTKMTLEAFTLLSEEQVKAIENSHPLGSGKPEDVARAAAFLLAPQNEWITGTNLVIDGGYTAQ